MPVTGEVTTKKHLAGDRAAGVPTGGPQPLMLGKASSDSGAARLSQEQGAPRAPPWLHAVLLWVTALTCAPRGQGPPDVLLAVVPRARSPARQAIYKHRTNLPHCTEQSSFTLKRRRLALLKGFVRVVLADRCSREAFRCLWQER